MARENCAATIMCCTQATAKNAKENKQSLLAQIYNRLQPNRKIS
jgi:hypothetical protein